jgi:hypothetical protein
MGDAKWHQVLTVFCSQKDEGEKSFSKLTVPCDKKKGKNDLLKKIGNSKKQKFFFEK